MKNNIISAILISIALSLSCQKNNQITPTAPAEKYVFDLSDSCGPEINYGSGQTPQFIYANNYKKWFQVNPNNPNEFIYYYEYGFTNHQLYVLSRSTLQSTQLLDKQIKLPPKWGRSGHILYYLNDSLFSIKSDGDSNALLAKGAYYCDWNYDGSKFLYNWRDVNTQIDYAVLEDFYSKQKDSLSMFLKFGTWDNPDNLYVLSSEAGEFKIVDMDLHTSYTIPLPYSGLMPYGYVWISNNEFVYIANSGTINKFNINTKINTKFIKFCNNIKPESIMYSYIANELFVSIKKYENIENSEAILVSTPQIMVFDLNTMTISAINL